MQGFTPGPGPTPGPWLQQGSIVYYPDGGAVLPSPNIPGGSKGPGTLNANGLFVQGVAVGVSGGSVALITQGVGIALTPDPISTTGEVALADTTATPGTYGDTTHVPQITVDQQGRITNANEVAIPLPPPSVQSITSPDGSLTIGGTLADTTIVATLGFFNLHYLQLTGGTLTGNLFVEAPTIALQSPDGGTAAEFGYDIDVGFHGHTNLWTYSNAGWGSGYNLGLARGTAAAPLAVASGDEIGWLGAGGYDGTAFVSGPFVDFVVDGTVSTGDVPVHVALEMQGGSIGSWRAWLAMPDGTTTFGKGGALAIDASGVTSMAAIIPPTQDDGVLATTKWVKDALAVVAVSPISIGITPPVGPVPGQLWWDSDGATINGGTLYVYYNDGNSTQWVPATGAPGPQGQPGLVGPTGPAAVRTYDEYTLYTPITSVISNADLIPAATAGLNIISRTITLTAGQRVHARFQGFGTNSGGPLSICAILTRSGNANALRAADTTVPTANYVVPLALEFEDAPGAGTFTYGINVGNSGAGTMWLNGGAARQFGGIAACTLTLEIF